MNGQIIDIDCRMNLIVEKRNGVFVVTDATILSDPELSVDLDQGMAHIPSLIAQAHLNCVPVFPLSNDGYFTIMSKGDEFVEWCKDHVSTIRGGGIK